MEDTPSTKDDAAPMPEGEGGPELPRLPVRSTEYSILQTLVGDQIPLGPLGPDTVPISVLTIPIGFMTEDLVRHLKRCQAPSCQYMPPSLQHFRKMRPQAIRGAKDQVFKAL